MVVRRLAQRTVLVVGEGDGDQVLLQHFKSLYVTRGCGTEFTVRQGYGGDAAEVVKHARRAANHHGFSECVVLIDTDKGWGPSTAQLANQLGVRVILSCPCLECWLLDAAGIQSPADGRRAKQLFLENFGGGANDRSIYPSNFSRRILDEARGRIDTIDRLILLFSGK